jgi:Ni/Co efflux regulator RcnB
MADSDIPEFKTYAEGELIPPVDSEDIKRISEYERTHSRVGSNGWEWLQGLKASLSPVAEFSDVSSRHGMIETLSRYKRGQLLAPWRGTARSCLPDRSDIPTPVSET